MYNPQLETFLRAADAGSFNKAAEESFITPTAVIKQINSLEESLGVRLFDRSHRGLTLTKAGRSMYQDARYIIQYCRDSVTRAKSAMQEDENIIRIGSSPMTPAQLLMALWPKSMSAARILNSRSCPLRTRRKTRGKFSAKTLIWWAAFSMKRCLGCAAAPGWN